MPRWNCSNFPPIPVGDPVFYLTNVLVIPTVTGIGVAGNLLLLLLVNRAHLRVQSPAYVYVTGIAIVDLLRLCLTLPSCLRDMGALSPSLAYSSNMVLFSNIAYAVTAICRHASVWLTSTGLVVLLCNLGNPWRKTRSSRITISRMVAFIVVLFCIMIDFPRFFELQLEKFTGKCFVEMQVWTWEFTELGRQDGYGAVYYWLTNLVCEILPLVIAIVMTVWIWIKYQPSTKEREEQLSVALLICGLVLIIVEFPSVCAHLYYSSTDNGFRRDKEFHTLALIAQCSSFLRCAANFIVFTIISAPFRKTFRRTFCCACITGDDYYEPWSCTCTSSSTLEEGEEDAKRPKDKTDGKKAEKKDKKDKSKKKSKKKKKSDSDSNSVDKEYDTSDSRLTPPRVVVVPPSPKKESQWI